MSAIPIQNPTSRKSLDYQVSRPNKKFRYPATKELHNEYVELGLKIALEPVVYDQILFSLYDLGFARQIPNTKAEAILFITNFHIKVAINNPTFPIDTPFFFVYRAFFDFCLYGNADRRFNTLEFIIKSFTKWIQTPGELQKAKDAFKNSAPVAPAPILPAPVRHTPEDRDDLINAPIEEINRLLEIYEKNKLSLGSYAKKLNATADFHKENLNK